MQALQFYDFFAGVGMVELALTPEWQCIWANDLDPKKAAIYRANHDPDVFHFGDVAAVEAAKLPSGAAMAWASFPCQDLSLAGWRRGMMAERSGTFWHFYRIMSELQKAGRRPPMIVLENVVGLLRDSDFSSLCEALDSLGMQFGALVIDASRFLPQSRPRVFVIAVDRDIDCREWVNFGPSEDWSSSALVSAYTQLPTRLLRQWRWWTLPAPTQPVATVESLVEESPEGVRWHTHEETAHLLNMMSPANLHKVEQQLVHQGKAIGFLYRRTRNGQQRAEVRFDGIAGCLRTSTGGSSRQTVMVVEDGAVRTRLLSPREAARLMGVNDGFHLPDSYNEAYHAMGDGVAVPAVRWLSQHLLLPMGELIRRERSNIRAEPPTSFPAAIAAPVAFKDDKARWIG